MSLRFIVTVALLLAASGAQALDVTTCGQVVPAGQVGTLVADLTCAAPVGFCEVCNAIGRRCRMAFDQPCSAGTDCPTSHFCRSAAVYLDRGATLDLNGHAVQGLGGGEPYDGVLCPTRCTVTGPGEIAHFARGGVDAFRSAIASNLAVHDVSNGSGLTAVRLRLENVEATGNQVGVAAFSLRVVDAVNSHGNSAAGASATHAAVKNLSVNDNGQWGIVSLGSLSAQGLVAQGNGLAGVGAQHCTLRDSTVNFNAVADVASELLPRLSGTTCGLSAHLSFDFGGTPSFGAAWGVCAND